MAENIVTIADLREHWPGIPESIIEDATQKLIEAEIEVLSLYPHAAERVLVDELYKRAVILVICRMVRRALEAPVEGMEGVASFAQSTGPFTQNFTFKGNDGSLYLTKADKRLLAGRLIDDGKAFTIYPGRL